MYTANLPADRASQPDASWAVPLRHAALRLVRAGLRGTTSRATAQCLRRVRDALVSDRLTVSLRELDRAWRCLLDEATTFAPLYGQLLLLEGRDYYAALGLLQRSLEYGPSPDTAALMALALLQLERAEDAGRQLRAALHEYCVAPGSILYAVAAEVARHPAIRTPGWVGRGPKLELLGELSAVERATVLDLAIDDGEKFSQLLPKAEAGAAPRRFTFRSPSSSLYSPLGITLRGVPLLGSGLRVPANFALDGRATHSGVWLEGWARMGWAPDVRLPLRIEDEKARHRTSRTGSAPFPGAGLPFRFNLRTHALRGSRIWVSARLPDGRWQALPDAPLLLERAVRMRHRAMRLKAWRSAPRTRRHRAIERAAVTDVIIPVYRGREETLACIDSVRRTTGDDARIVVVDDATEDAALAAALDALSAGGGLTLLRNPQNLGFVASVNRALALHPTHDAVLLNSDTRVFDDWLPRLRAAAYSGRRVGTVTPLSNAGSIASYPHARGAEVSPEYAQGLHALARATHPGRSVEIPVGVGFCLYVRRDCLRDVGELDVALFAKGYGEEVDFCLRARRRGWSHRLAADVFVYHAGGLSFGPRRTALLDRSQRLISLRYPGYDGFIASFQAQDPVQPLRRRLDEHRLSAFQGRFVLLVTLALQGGVERFVAERCREIRARGLHPLLLRPAGDSRHCELSTDALELPNLRFDIPRDLRTLTGLLRGLRIEALEIQHFLHLDARLIEAVLSLPLPYDVFVHDYAWICPRITLIDGSGRYCGEPAVRICQHCIRRNGSMLGDPIGVAALRARSGRWLRGARRVIAPSQDTATRLRRHFIDLLVEVRPHASPEPCAAPPPQPAERSTLRVALLGAIGDHKGYAIVLACARDARARGLPIEFVVIGYTRDDESLLATGKAFITGRYSEAEAPHLLSREAPDLIWLPSVWPETWSYTLDYALGSGVPIVAFDLGAIAERLRAAGTGVLLPLDLAPGALNDRLLQFETRAAAAVKLTRSVQSPLPQPDYDAKMGALPAFPSEKTSMNNNPGAKPTATVREEGMSASVQVLPLPPGLYLFSVKASGTVSPRTNGELSLPAVHVGLGPGVRTEQVDFVAGPSTHGAWLFAPGDLLVTKVNGAGATLVMTSVRAPGGDVLSIKVERLEARAEASAPPRDAVSHVAAPDKPTRKRNGKTAATRSRAGAEGSAKPLLPLQIALHVRARGDMTFTDVPWAGRVAPGLWVEAFSVRPLEVFGAQDIEYKGLTGSGFETPWLSEDKMCGTKGMAVPLIGFAVRLKPGAASADYDCEYSGYFQSGVTIGPLRNGAPCRSSVANDPLEGIQVRLLKRAPLPDVVSTAAPARTARVARAGAGRRKVRSLSTGRSLGPRHAARRP